MSRQFGGHAALVGALFLTLLILYAVTPLTGASRDTAQTAGTLRYLLPALFVGAAVTALLLPKRYVFPIGVLVIAANVVGDFTEPSYRPDLFMTGETLLVAAAIAGVIALLIWVRPRIRLRRMLYVTAPVALDVVLFQAFPAQPSIVPVSAVHRMAPSWDGQVVVINVDDRSALLGTSMGTTFKTAPAASTTTQLSAFLDRAAPTVVAVGHSSLPGPLPTNGLVKPSWRKLAESNGTSIYLIPGT
jgi:hypothetical protein